MPNFLGKEIISKSALTSLRCGNFAVNLARFMALCVRQSQPVPRFSLVQIRIEIRAVQSVSFSRRVNSAEPFRLMRQTNKNIIFGYFNLLVQFGSPVRI